MRLTSRIDYGLRAMLDLAMNHGAQVVQNHDISRRQKIPEQYLKQILPALRRRGLVASTRGPQGGHRLARLPSEVSVAEIIRALEGGVDILEIGQGRNDGGGMGESGKILNDFWEELSGEVERFMKMTTLEDLCRRKRRQDRSFIYHI